MEFTNRKKTTRAPSTIGGAEWLRNYPKAAPRSVHNPDDHSSIVEEDTILCNNLQLLEMPSAMENWLELRDVQCHISEDMFLKPNRNGMQVVLYFLMACLLGRDQVKRQFKGCWPPASIAHRQDFKSRAVELVKKHGPLWQIDPGKIACIGAMLQRHAGLKMVEFLCSMSHAALVLTYQRHFPGDVVLPKSVQDSLLDCEIDLGEESERAALCEMVIGVGKSKVSIQQQNFLHKIQVLNHMKKAYSTAADSIMEEHALLSNERAKYAHATGLLQGQLDNGEMNQARKKSLKQAMRVEAIAENIVGIKQHLDRFLGKDTSFPNGLSYSDVLYTGMDTKSGSDNRQPASDLKCPNSECIPGEPQLKGLFTAILKPPSDLLVAPYNAGKSTFSSGASLKDDTNTGYLTSKKQTQIGNPSLHDVSLLESMNAWHTALKELQSAASSVVKSSRAQSIVSNAGEIGGSNGDASDACNLLKENLRAMEELKASVLSEDSLLDEEIENIRTKILSSAEKHMDRQLSLDDFALDFG